MTDRTISLAAAIEEIEAIVDTMSVCISMDECKGMRRMKQSVLEKIKALPPAQPGEDIRAMCGECDAWNQYKNYSQPGWIPCSKKLPELNRSVLVQLSDDFVDPIQIMTLNISKCEGDFFYFWETQEMGINFEMGDVVAWMPLPKPWEGKEQ